MPGVVLDTPLARWSPGGAAPALVSWLIVVSATIVASAVLGRALALDVVDRRAAPALGAD